MDGLLAKDPSARATTDRGLPPYARPAQRPETGPLGEASPRPADPAAVLPVGKLRGVSYEVRLRLKRRGITRCGQLLRAAATAVKRAGLASATGVAEETLHLLVKRADVARVNGVGATFALMLEHLGLDRVDLIAAEAAEDLHERLRALNREERLARRSPTPEEVGDWVDQARRLPRLVDR